MAAALAKDFLRRRGVEDMEVLSAGELACQGQPASAEACRIMEEFGLSLEDHRSCPLDDEKLRGADLVLTMTLAQRDRLRRRYPEEAGRIFALKEYAVAGDADADRTRALALASEVAAAERRCAAGEKDPELGRRLAEQSKKLSELSSRIRDYNVEDPIGQGAAAYRRCAEKLREAVEKALARFLDNPT
jgi:protein-tyrosine phosphatase